MIIFWIGFASSFSDGVLVFVIIIDSGSFIFDEKMSHRNDDV